MKYIAGFLTALFLVTPGCGGDQVALNERFFSASSMESLGGGCTLYALGSGGQESTSTSALGFDVRQQRVDRSVIVEVKRGDQAIVERQYDEAFFRSGSVDEVMTSVGAGTNLMLRYWGRFHPNGTAGCTSLEYDLPETSN